MEKPERAPVLGRIMGRIETDLATLTALDARLAGQEVAPEHRDLARHQLATLDYGIAAHRFALTWFRDHAARA
jgi:hypothetical protein